jgi:hypothetical protein
MTASENAMRQFNFRKTDSLTDILNEGSGGPQL